MLNKTTNNSKTTVKSSPSGIIQRSKKDSFFIRMHYNSPNAKNDVFTEDPTYNDKPITVLQVMNIPDGYLLIEMIYEEDVATSTKII